MMEAARGIIVHKSSASRHRQCALCLDKFKSPRILPCFHTFCLVCLEQLVKNLPHINFGFPCPTCRQMITVPSNGVSQFQTNFYIEAEMEALSLQSSTKELRCEMCGGVPVTTKCLDCNQFACSPCTRIHASIVATRTHRVLNLDSLKKEEGINIPVIKERFCSAHNGEKMRFYCTVCNCVICRDCKLTSHEGHKTTDLPQKAAEAKEILMTVTQKSRQNLQPLLQQVLGEAENLHHEVGTQRQEILKRFQQRADELRLTVDSCLKNAELKLRMTGDDAEKTISESVQEMQLQLTSFYSLLEHVESVASSGSDADVLELPAQIHEFFGKTENVYKNKTFSMNAPRRVLSFVPVFGRNTPRAWTNPNQSPFGDLLSEVGNEIEYGEESNYQGGWYEGMANEEELANIETPMRRPVTVNAASQPVPGPVSVSQHLKIFTDTTWRIGINVSDFNQNGEDACVPQELEYFSRPMSSLAQRRKVIGSRSKAVKYNNKSSITLQTLTNQMAAYIGDVQKTTAVNIASVSTDNQIIASRRQKKATQRQNVSENINAQILWNIHDINITMAMLMK